MCFHFYLFLLLWPCSGNIWPERPVARGESLKRGKNLKGKKVKRQPVFELRLPVEAAGFMETYEQPQH